MRPRSPQLQMPGMLSALGAGAQEAAAQPMTLAAPINDGQIIGIIAAIVSGPTPRDAVYTAAELLAEAEVYGRVSFRGLLAQKKAEFLKAQEEAAKTPPTV